MPSSIDDMELDRLENKLLDIPVGSARRQERKTQATPRREKRSVEEGREEEKNRHLAAFIRFVLLGIGIRCRFFVREANK